MEVIRSFDSQALVRTQVGTYPLAGKLVKVGRIYTFSSTAGGDQALKTGLN